MRARTLDDQVPQKILHGESTLYDVVVHPRLMTDLELAERHARKALRMRPVLSSDESLDDVNPVQVVVDLEERIEEEQLSDSVAEVQQLDGHVPGD